jgi:Galactose oxidase, central domain
MPPIFWTQKQDIGPSSRIGHGLTHDTSRQRVVLFGGDPGGPPLDDTWAWDGSLWTQIADTGPSARHSLAMVHESGPQRVLLFGGASGSTLFGDTWVCEGPDWTQLADTGPSARSGHAMAYDPVRQRAVLFGGRTGTDAFGDTWEWDGTEWTQREDVGPSARSGHAMAYDIAGSRVVLFGGAGTNGTGLGDTWAWNGTTWTQIADTGPDPRTASAIVADGGALLFGGVNSADPGLSPSDRIVYGDSWRLEGDLWSKVQDIGPSGRWGHGLALRVNAGRIVLFGGSSIFAAAQDAALVPGLRRDTWEVASTAAQPEEPNPDEPPSPVEVAAVSVSPDAVAAEGDVIDVVVDLTGPAPTDINLVAAIFFDQGAGFEPAQPPGFTLPDPLTVSAGSSGAQFPIVRDSQPLTPGQYAIGVGVEGGTLQGGLFTVN